MNYQILLFLLCLVIIMMGYQGYKEIRNGDCVRLKIHPKTVTCLIQTMATMVLARTRALLCKWSPLA